MGRIFLDPKLCLKIRKIWGLIVLQAHCLIVISYLKRSLCDSKSPKLVLSWLKKGLHLSIKLFKSTLEWSVRLQKSSIVFYNM